MGQNKNEEEIFFDKIQRTLELIGAYGSIEFRKKYGKSPIEEDLTDLEKSNYFFSKVHEGWGYGQEEIYSELLVNEEKKIFARKLLKEVNAQKNNEEVKKCKLVLSDLGQKERILRSLADYIAWMILHNEHHIAHRFIIKDCFPQITSTNLASDYETVKQFNKQDPLSFSLLTDLTSFVHIGDVLRIKMINGVGIKQILELKEGHVNDEIFKDLDAYFGTGGCPYYLSHYEKHQGKKKVDQFQRVYRQAVRATRLSKVIENEGGIGPTGENIVIPTETFILEEYTPDIRKMVNQLSTNDGVTKIIEDCLYVGLYGPNGETLKKFQEWLKDKGVIFPIFDFRQGIANLQVRTPFILTTCGLTSTIVLDLIFGKKILYSCLNFDKFLSLGNELGIKIHWTKRTDNVRLKSLWPLKIQNRSIQISYPSGENMLLGRETLARIIWEFVKPTSILKCYKSDPLVTMIKRGMIKLDRNDVCYCGSGKKFKNCCMRKIC